MKKSVKMWGVFAPKKVKPWDVSKTKRNAEEMADGLRKDKVRPVTVSWDEKKAEKYPKCKCGHDWRTHEGKLKASRSEHGRCRMENCDCVKFVGDE